MYPIKVKDVEEREVVFLHNYKKMSFVHAYIKTVYYKKEKKFIFCRIKNCAQRLIGPEETVYREWDKPFKL